MSDNTILFSDADRIIRSVDLSELNEKTIMITGGTGLLGTYLLASVKQFIGGGGKPKKLILVAHDALPQHLKAFEESDWVDVRYGDLTDFGYIESLPTADYIIHAAGSAQPSVFMKRPVATLTINTSATARLIEKLNPKGRFLFISSSAVYSGSPNVPYKETDIGVSNTDNMRSPYIEGKRCGEAICNAYAADGANGEAGGNGRAGIEARSVRFAMAYGPGVRSNDQRVMYSFIRKARTEGVIRMMDSGSAMKMCCYISDAVELLWNVLLRGTDRIYNIGGHSKLSILELAHLIADHYNVSVEVPTESDNVLGAPQFEYLDMTKTEKEFGKAEYVPFETGIANTIDWCEVNWS